MPAAEPTIGQFAGNALAKYVAATRPPFLLASVVPALLGFATAFYAGAALNVLAALLTIVGAVVIHAGVNVLNDYYDALNGTDERNTERIYPFTGGSRFIQNGVLTTTQTARYGAALLFAGMLVGVVLLPFGGPVLMYVGLAGLLIGWAYSAPPLALNSRGLGEIAVAVGFGALIPLGAHVVQRGSFDTLPLIAAFPYALLASALLYLNQFPDLKADAAAGKHHWVVRLGAQRARWGYLILVLSAYASLGLAVLFAALPAWSLLGLTGLPWSLRAAVLLLAHAQAPARLAPVIRLTIGASLIHGIFVAAGLIIAAI